MSSPYDSGGGGDDRYCQLNTPSNELHRMSSNQQHQHQQPNTAHLYTGTINDGIPLQQPPQNHLMWQNAMLGAPFIQTTMLQNQGQQHQYNEFLYNMHVPQAYNMPAAQPETYSVLPVGHGNFLKIYHCPDSGEGSIPTELTQQHFQQHYQGQQLQNAPYHLNQQPSTQPQYFNNYELFSSGTLLTPQESGLHIPNTQQQPTHTVQQQQNQLNQSQQSKVPNQQPVINEQLTTTNLIINKLVNNWSPNLTGGTYTQFGASPHSESTTDVPPIMVEGDVHLTVTKANIQNSETISTHVEDDSPKTFNASSTCETTIASVTATIHTNQKYEIKEEILANEPPPTKLISSPVPQQTSATTVVPEVKKRIVAEVKPMRMTYSDVLIKLNSQQATHASHLVTKTNTTKSKKIGACSTINNTDRKNEIKHILRQSGNADTEAATIIKNNGSKKSPTHDNKENHQVNPSTTTAKIKKRCPNNLSGTTNNVILPEQSKKPIQQRPIPKTTNSNNESSNKKRYNNGKRSDSLSDTQSSNNSRNQKQDKDSYNAYYNVTVKNNGDSRATNNNAPTNGPTNATQRKNANYKSGSSSINHYSNHSNNSISNSNNFYGNHQSRIRYSNSNNSYSFSTKRSRATNSTLTFGSSITTGITSNRNYELAKKILRTWANYMLKAIIWLYYLIYDIIVLSCGILYERLTNACISGLAYGKQLHKGMKQNSNKPGIWIKNYWRRFDARFAKDSRWAIWRKLNKKKPPEATSENFKNGRIPSTGEEAMYSLLNCKGKDAYSILGVPPNCPQEQIRKHYKKIAVLVHPDKNKQAGAEEAFKVLQRAFELIGEPENRLAYDQSLVEALHAEKAWTELHDLLSQLQNKITEAANTIRCSTCAQRHPRKIVDRPHYAARECGACKMRHSAREGDIWAETSLLGIRWKYLALMEGKVYDITDWANCQKGALAHLEPNSHMVQYRIVRGAQQQQQHQHQSKRESHNKRHQYAHTSNEAPQPFPPGAAPWERGSGNAKFQHDIPQTDGSFQEFPFNLYGSQNPNQSNASGYTGSSRRRTRRN